MNLILDLNGIELGDVKPIGVHKAKQQLDKMLEKNKVDETQLFEIVKRNSGAAAGLYMWAIDFIKAYDQNQNK